MINSISPADSPPYPNTSIATSGTVALSSNLSNTQSMAYSLETSNLSSSELQIPGGTASTMGTQAGDKASSQMTPPISSEDPTKPLPTTTGSNSESASEDNATAGTPVVSNMTTTKFVAPDDPSNPTITVTSTALATNTSLPYNADFVDLDDWVPTTTSGSVTVDGIPFNFSLLDLYAHPPSVTATSTDTSEATSALNIVLMFQALTPQMKDASDRFYDLAGILGQLDDAVKASDRDGGSSGGGSGASGGGSGGGSKSCHVANLWSVANSKSWKVEEEVVEIMASAGFYLGLPTPSTTPSNVSLDILRH